MAPRDDLQAHQRLSLRIRGRVQGVGYRGFVRKQARALGLRGWVRNEPSGAVAIVTEGPPAQLVRLRELCDQGPPFARVDQVEAIWDDATGEFPGFDIRIDGR